MQCNCWRYFKTGNYFLLVILTKRLFIICPIHRWICKSDFSRVLFSYLSFDGVVSFPRSAHHFIIYLEAAVFQDFHCVFQFCAMVIISYDLRANSCIARLSLGFFQFRAMVIISYYLCANGCITRLMGTLIKCLAQTPVE